MTTPLPPPEPLDAQERELARILRALPGGEPPAALDAAILRAAANAAAASRRPGARLFASAGALWGIGGAAAAVLALGVAIQMRISPEHPPAAETSPRAQAVSDLAEDDAVQVEFGADREGAATVASPPPPPPVAEPEFAAKPRLREPLRRDAPAPAAPAAAAPAAPEAFAADALDEHVPRESALNAIDVDSVESTTVLSAEQKQRADAEERQQQPRAAKSAAAPQQEAAAGAGSRAEAADAAALGGLAAAPVTAPKKPATWLAEIRQLRDEGKIEAARVKLVEFRRAYPQWVIPTDLAPLLSE